MPAYEVERATAREAVKAAGMLCMAVRQEMLGSPEKMEKAGKEPVTIADYGAQAIILREIRSHFPNDAALAEEWADDFFSLSTEDQKAAIYRHITQSISQPSTPDDLRAWLDFGRGIESGRVWVVDPIDGTKGFLRGDQFAIALALLDGGEPVVGALCCPALPVDPANPNGELGVILTAIKGQGVRFEAMYSNTAMRRSSVSAHGRDAARAVESIEHSDHSFSADIYRAAALGGDLVRMDSQAKYVAVADGRAEVYLRQSRSEDYKERVWDHAAGVLIVQEAGGRVTDLRGKPIEFNHGGTLAANSGILATNGLFHDELLAIIQAM